MEFVWQSGASVPKTRKRIRQDKSADADRRKKKCSHKDDSPSNAGVAENDTPESSPSPVRVGDYHPESILTELSGALDGKRTFQGQPSNPQIESHSRQTHFRLSRTAPDLSFEKHQTEWWNHCRRRQTSLPLLEYQQKYLEAAGAFLILPKSTTDILIPTYVSVIDGLVPVVDGAQVLREYNHGKASPLLVRAICLVTCKTEQAAPFLRLHDDDCVLAPLVFAQKLYEGLNAAVRAELECDRITQIQILALMHLYNDGLRGVERASIHLSQAIHDSWFISLHYTVAGNPIQSRCDKLWWSLRCFDRLNKFIVGAPFMIADSDIQIARPEAGQSYQSRVLAILMNLGDLLFKVEEEVYSLKSNQEIGGVEDFPPFSELTKQTGFHEFQTSHREYLEIWYHVAAMLSCRSSSPGTGPYLRRSKSADRIQEMMSHGRHAHLPPLPLIPYAIAMSLTVAYRALREDKNNFEEGMVNLRVRLEILESLGAIWTTAKVMAKLAKRAFKVLERMKMRSTRGYEPGAVARQARNREELPEVQTNEGIAPSATGRSKTSRNVNLDNYENGSGSYRPQEQNGRTDAFITNEAENPADSSDQANAEHNYEWPANDMYFNFGPDPFYDLSSFGMGNVFRDLSGWGVSPDVTDGGSSASTIL